MAIDLGVMMSQGDSQQQPLEALDTTIQDFLKSWRKETHEETGGEEGTW